MSEKRWKVFERRICRALGGDRRGPLGRAMSDCTDDIPFAVECKHAKTGTPQGAWIAQARSHGKKENRPWLLVTCQPGSSRPIVTLDFFEFAELAQRAGVIATPLEVGPEDE